ncbi:hypothetical protein GCM10009443_27660 [Mucilaginibacter ginsenosidivorans]
MNSLRNVYALKLELEKKRGNTTTETIPISIIVVTSSTNVKPFSLDIERLKSILPFR